MVATVYVKTEEEICHNGCEELRCRFIGKNSVYKINGSASAVIYPCSFVRLKVNGRSRRTNGSLG